jgi:nucleoside-diphosphate-sugar epimerase
MRILMAGARGEVGLSVSEALTNEGHVVTPVSSRISHVGPPLLSLSQASDLIHNGEVDLLVIASSRGDHRGVAVSGTNTCEALTPAVSATGLPSVLLSTLRVLEGHTEATSEDAPASPTSDYAQANARNEEVWLKESGPSGSVLRLANYFCVPQGVNSPQNKLLPWSLMTEAVESGSITVRSGAGTSREFVSASDVGRAILLLATDSPPTRVCATLPGHVANMRDLVLNVKEAFSMTGRPDPLASFGIEDVIPTEVAASWLASHGWISALDRTEIVRGITSELLHNYSGNTQPNP